MLFQSYHRHNQGRLLGFQATTVVTPSASLGIGSMDATIARAGAGQPTITPRLQFARRPVVIGCPANTVGNGSYIGQASAPTASAMPLELLTTGGTATDGTGDIIALGWDSSNVDETGLQTLVSSIQRPRLIAARIESSGTVSQGKKDILSVNRSSAGVYEITFNQAFGRAPAIAVCGDAAARFGSYSSKTPGSVTINLADEAGNLANGRFHFIALGQEGSDEYGKMRNPLMSNYELHPVAFSVIAGSTTFDVGAADASGIVKNGTGDFTITFKRPFGKIPVAAATARGQGKVYFSSVTATAIRVLTTTNLNVAADLNFDLIVFGSPERGE